MFEFEYGIVTFNVHFKIPCFK